MDDLPLGPLGPLGPVARDQGGTSGQGPRGDQWTPDRQSWAGDWIVGLELAQSPAKAEQPSKYKSCKG